MPASDPAIRIQGLRAAYGERVILPDLTVDFARGRVTTIVGGSGCGKSTLLKAIVGLLTPTAGSVFVDGQELTRLDEVELPRALTRVGLLFQHGAMLNSLTVADNVALPLRLHTDLPDEVIDEMVRLKLELVSLPEAGPLLPSELSGGMLKRAALARAMALDPPILLCDEPSAGLDPQTAASLDRLILRLEETFRMTVVVVTHELASIEAIADDVVMLGKGGRLLFAGSLADARGCDAPEVRAFFARSMPELDGATTSLLAALEGASSSGEAGP